MADDWTMARLRDHTELLVGPAFDSAGFRAAPPGVRLARGDNVTEGQFRWGDKTRYWPEVTGELGRYLLREGDVLIGMDGSKVGRNWTRVRESDLPCLLVQRVACLRARSSLDQGFLVLLVSSDLFKDHVDAVRTGSSIPHISGNQIGEFSFKLPPLPQQRTIAHILGTLDDKIELNRRMNETLEAMARALFKSWFVDFDPVRAKAEGRDPGLPKPIADLFPDAFEDSELGEIPKGWEVGPLGKFFTVGLGGAWGEDEPSARATLAVRCLRGIDCHDLAEGNVPEVPIRWLSPDQARDRRLADGTLLIEGSGSFCGRSLLWRSGYADLIGEPVAYSNFCKRLDPLSTTSQAVVCWLRMRQAYRDGELQAFRTGTAFPNFDVHGAMSGLFVVVPPAGLAEVFARQYVLTQRLDVLAQNRTLAALRDTLLPKLISGELRIRDAERIAVNAA